MGAKVLLRLGLLVMFLCFGLSFQAGGQDNMTWKATSAFTFESGDFGTGIGATTAYIPFTIHRYVDRWDLSMVVPYLYQNSPRGIVASAGRAVRIRKSELGRQASGGGVGDLLMSGRYELLTDGELPFSLAGLAQMKAPTGDNSAGLSTGKFDVGGGLDAGLRIRRWAMYETVSYWLIGRPRGTDLNNVVAFSVGLGYGLRPSTELIIFYDGKTPLLDGAPAPRELRLSVDHQFRPTLNLFGDVTRGLSDGSPDIGVTAGMGLRF